VLPPATFHILISLAGGERHGYAIAQEVAAATGNSIKLSPGTLYRSLQRMLEQGLIVESGGDERRRFYKITPAGEEAVREESRRLAAMLRLAEARGL
jgi:DNA-binding PadR family transcriptional regulator